MSECVKCGSPLQEGQDWCLQCGTGAPGSLGAGGPGWRTGVAILVLAVALVGGAAVAAVAALDKTTHKPAAAVVAKVTATTTPTPTSTSTTATKGATAPGVPTTLKAKAPKIPLQTPTPKSSSSEALFPPETKTEPAKTTTTGESTTGSTGSSETKTKSTTGAEAPSPILLDTNAASVYNPYAYPASLFGEPSYAIDGEEKTAWTAQVQPAEAPKMAEGLVLDLKTAQKLGSATVKTTTTGVSVEIYATNGATLPSTILAPGWVRLAGLKVLKKKITTLKLRTKGKSYRYVLLWLAKAPPGSTESDPGQVAINELELFPPASS